MKESDEWILYKSSVTFTFAQAFFSVMNDLNVLAPCGKYSRNILITSNKQAKKKKANWSTLAGQMIFHIFSL